MAEVPLPTPTQAPVPSTDIRNAVFAGAKLDEEVTGTGEFYTDRLGAKRLTNTGRNNQFDAAQLDRANRFEQFLLSSGYVFLGDYEDGPFQFSARNQYIRYNNQYYRLNAATDVGFTTTGTDATSFANDVTHFVLMDGDTLRQNLDSDEEGNSGGTLVALEEKISVQDALSPMLYSGRVVRLSVFYARGLRDDAAFAAAFAASKNADGYNCRVIINDTPYVVEITDTIYKFQTSESTRYNLRNYGGYNCGVVGEFKFHGEARFLFEWCYKPYVNVLIQGGVKANGVNKIIPELSSRAVQFEKVIVGAEVHIDTYQYNGYGLATFGKNTPRSISAIGGYQRALSINRERLSERRRGLSGGDQWIW